MWENILARMYKYASNGDIKAAKVFLAATESITGPARVQNQQNNYIQINGIVITEDQKQNLSPENLRMIESIFSESTYK